MQIQIKDSSTNEIDTVDVDGNDTIYSIKEKVASKHGTDASQINLVFNGKNLVNNKTVNDYDIKDGSIFHQVLQLKGGNM